MRNAMKSAPEPVGLQLQRWRRQRRRTQLDLALEAGLSQRHLSFVETGRASPSRETLFRLAEVLAVPVRERNALFAGAGFAPVHRETAYDDPDFAMARATVERLLEAHAPHPALAVDRHWNLLAANGAIFALIGDVSRDLMRPPVNVLRLSLHPDGLAGRIGNFREWRAHVLMRLSRQVDASGDRGLAELRAELERYPVPAGALPYRPAAPALDGIAVPFVLQQGDRALSFISTTTVFGTAVDITLAELTIETFFPADAQTAEAMRDIAPPTMQG